MSAQIIRSRPGAGGPAGDQVADHYGGSARLLGLFAWWAIGADSGEGRIFMHRQRSA